MNTYEGRKFAVITGGSSGIGYEFAKVCADENFEVLVVAEQGVEEAAERLRAGGAAVTGLQADLATYEGNDGVACGDPAGRPAGRHPRVECRSRCWWSVLGDRPGT
jgi:NAD(P)-dependent dehydrogenase (short-subunit alcohol dehydrogenase family)